MTGPEKISKKSIFDRIKDIIGIGKSQQIPAKTKEKFTIPSNITDENRKTLLEIMNAEEIKKHNGGLIQSFQKGGKVLTHDDALEHLITAIDLNKKLPKDILNKFASTKTNEFALDYMRDSIEGFTGTNKEHLKRGTTYLDLYKKSVDPSFKFFAPKKKETGLIQQAEEAGKAIRGVGARAKAMAEILEATKATGGKIPQYEHGGYVPENTLAYLHGGEVVLPAEKSSLKVISSSGEKIGAEIKRAIEDALKDIKVEVKDKKMEVETESFDRSIDRLATIFDKTINVAAPTAVGADNSLSRLDEFIEVVDKEFSAYRLDLNDNIEKVREIKEIIPTLQTARMIDSAEDNSHLKKELHELLNDLENFTLIPMDTRIRTVERLTESMRYNIDNNSDLITSLNNRSSLTV